MCVLMWFIVGNTALIFNPPKPTTIIDSTNRIWKKTLWATRVLENQTQKPRGMLHKSNTCEQCLHWEFTTTHNFQEGSKVRQEQTWAWSLDCVTRGEEVYFPPCVCVKRSKRRRTQRTYCGSQDCATAYYTRWEHLSTLREHIKAWILMWATVRLHPEE